MRKLVVLSILLMCVAGVAQTPTPNIGLQIPPTGSNNWYIPLNYNFNRIDLLLSGNLPIPGLSVQGNVNVTGTITAGSFVGVGGGSFVTVSGTPVAGNCAKWLTSTVVTDAMLPCGSGSGTITLTGPVTGSSSSGTIATAITATGVGAGNYNLAATPLISVGADGRIISIGNPFAVGISSCSACGTFEIGQATSNPATFTLNYANGTPNAASITDGTLTDNLSSPYTSGSLASSYCQAGQGQTSFTFSVSATATSGQSAGTSNGVSCQPRTFAGTGTAGATNATASGTSAVLNGGAGTLADIGLGSNFSGQIFNVNTTGLQTIYLLLTGGSYTFHNNSTGFAMPADSVTPVSFVNQYSATTSLFLYAFNGLEGSYAPKID